MNINNFEVKPKYYKKTKKSIHINALRPNLLAFAPNLPWHDFSFEGGYIFSHLDGEMVGGYETNQEETKIRFD